MIKGKKKLETKDLAKIGVLSVISLVLSYLKIQVWFAPSFLKLDISDLPALIGSFAMSPIAGVFIQLLKNILNLMTEGTVTGGVGELSNFIVGSAFILSSGLIYHRNKTYKNAIKGLIFGVITMTIFATISNYFVVFPLYSKLQPLDEIIEFARTKNRFIVDYKTLILYAVVPFNLFKGTVTSIVTMLVYKKVSPILKK